MTGSGRTVLAASLTLQLVIGLSAALLVHRRGGSAAGRDDFASRDQLTSSDKKEAKEDVSIRYLTELVEQLAAKRRRSGSSLELKSRESDLRRAAFDDEDPLHILLGNERPDSTATRAQKDERTLSNFVKRKPLPVPSKVQRSDGARQVARDQNQRELEQLARAGRQDFMYAIGAAQQPSYGGSSYDHLGSRPYGSQGWPEDSNDDGSNAEELDYTWVECDEDDPDPDCQEQS